MKLELSNVSKHFGANVLFTNVTCHLADHEIVGVIGNNGAGKSTLCNIIAGVDRDYDGIFHTYPGTKVAYFKQILDQIDDGDMSVFDYVLSTQQHQLVIEAEYYSMLSRLKSENVTPELLENFGVVQEQFYNEGAFDLLERIEQVLFGLGIYQTAELSEMHGKRNITWITQIKNLSGGERKIVELATILLNRTADVLILDEPTNHLDIEARAWFEQFIRNFAGSVILVSHDRHLLNSITSKIWEVANNTLTIFKGNYDFYEKVNNERFEAKVHQYEEEKKELERLELMVNELHRKVIIGGSPSIISQYRAKQTILEKHKQMMIQNRPERRTNIDLTLAKIPPRGYVLLKLENFNFSFDNEKQIFKNETLTITKDDKVALLGANGIGKSTLFKLILTKYCLNNSFDPTLFGIDEFFWKYKDSVSDDAMFYIGPSIKGAYYSQHHNQLPDELTIRELLQQSKIKDESQFQKIIR